jgi:hypothetical protein
MSLNQPANRIDMDQFESNTHSFIIKIWLEETFEEVGQATWRGRITHVSSGNQHYLTGLDDITAFSASYLGEMGVKFGMLWRVWQRLKQWKRHMTRES